MRKLVSLGVIAGMLAGTAPAYAKQMNCSLNANYAKAILGMSPFTYNGTTYQLVQTKTFTGTPDEIGEQNSHVSVQWTVTKATQLMVPVQGRTRSPADCLIAIADGNKTKWWSGMGCDDSNYHDTGTHYPLMLQPPAPPTDGSTPPATCPDATPAAPWIYAMGGATSTVNYVSQFMGFYAQTSTAKSYALIGACVES